MPDPIVADVTLSATAATPAVAPVAPLITPQPAPVAPIAPVAGPKAPETPPLPVSVVVTETYGFYPEDGSPLRMWQAETVVTDPVDIATLVARQAPYAVS